VSGAGEWVRAGNMHPGGYTSLLALQPCERTTVYESTQEGGTEKPEAVQERSPMEPRSGLSRDKREEVGSHINLIGQEGTGVREARKGDKRQALRTPSGASQGL